MTSYLYNDLETFSPVPINNGTHAYAEAAEVMLWAFAVDERPTEVWDVTSGAPMPALLEDTLHDPDVLTIWHNGGMFDNTVLHYAMPDHELPVERIHDTMVQALTHGLPGSLDKLCDILMIPTDQAKGKRGKELINLFCKPQPKNRKIRRATRETHPAEWAEFIDYAAHDITAMRAIRHKLPLWNYRDGELALWHLDQKINARGFSVDLELARSAVAAVESAQRSLAARTAEITNGQVGAATQRDKLLKYILAEHGVDLPDMQAGTLERRMGDEALPKAVRELLAIRLQASTSSTAKYQKLLNAVSRDGRLRGTLQYAGANRTGRWAGRTFQPQNLMRPTMKQPAIEQGIAAMKAGCADVLYDNVMEVAGNAMRGVIVPSEGKKLVVSDLSNIEGRFAAWLAGEEWKLQAFRDYDQGTGPDLYRLAYAKAFNMPPDDVDGGEDKGPQRQVGKVLELFMQYEGGVGAFITGALTYGIELDELAEVAWSTIPADILGQAADAYRWAVKNHRTYGLVEKTYIVCDALKRMWREAHPAIASYWPELRNAMTEAIVSPGVPVVARRLKFQRDGAWLRMVLPSGRALCYASPKIDERGKITYAGVNPYTRQWGRVGTYGGKLFENACQGGACDVMKANMPKIEQARYDIILTVHDEVLTEAPDTDDYNAADLSSLLAAAPRWAGNNLPLAAGGFDGYRYRKD